jgi:hypothetical protein
MGARLWGVVVLLAVMAAVAGCGSSASGDWVASEVYVVDDRSACMEVTDRRAGRTLSVCRDDEGVVTCRTGEDGADAATRADCDAAIRAVESWEEAGGA